MDATTKAQIEKRVAAFTFYRNHVGDALICKLLHIGKPTLQKWQREDDWQERRASLLQMEVMPGWASDLLTLLVLQSKKLAGLEQQLVALQMAGATAKPATLNYQPLLLICEDAQQQQRMVGISDCAGGDSSTTLHTYAQQTPSCYYVPCAPPAKTSQALGRLAFVQAILASMNLEPATQVADGVAAITARLNELGKGLLIFDKADYLTDKNLLLLLAIYDTTDNRAGIVLAAEDLRQHINRLAQLERPGFQELQRRISYWHEVGQGEDITL